jgi:hypothetical protein
MSADGKREKADFANFSPTDLLTLIHNEHIKKEKTPTGKVKMKASKMTKNCE